LPGADPRAIATRELRIRAALVGAAALVFALAALLYNELLLGLFARDGLRAETAAHVRVTQLSFAVISAGLAAGAAMLVRRAAIDDIGGMDERMFLYGEDVEWCYRMWERGWQVHLVPKAVMSHHYELSSRRTLDLRSQAVRHHWASILKLYALHPRLVLGWGPRVRARQ
jgi:GT2 family glycosyltransferase